MSRGELPPTVDSLARRQGRAAALKLMRGDGADRCPYDANAGSVTQQRLARAWTEAHRETMGPVDDSPLPD